MASNDNVYTNKITKSPPQKNYLTKEEYMKILQEQMRERQAQIQAQRNLEEMQDRLEDLRISHKLIMKQLESQSASPQSSI